MPLSLDKLFYYLEKNDTLLRVFDTYNKDITTTGIAEEKRSFIM